MKIKASFLSHFCSRAYFILSLHTHSGFNREGFTEVQIIQLLFSTFTILMFIFQIIPYFSTKNILPDHYFFLEQT